MSNQKQEKQTLIQQVNNTLEEGKKNAWRIKGRAIALSIALCWGIINAVAVAAVTSFWLPIVTVGVGAFIVNAGIYWQEVPDTFIEIFVNGLTKELSAIKKVILITSFLFAIVGGMANAVLFMDFALIGAASVGLVAAAAWPLAIALGALMFVSVVALTIGAVSDFLREKRYAGLANFFRGFVVKRPASKADQKTLKDLREKLKHATTKQEKNALRTEINEEEAKMEKISLGQHVIESVFKGAFLLLGLSALAISSFTLFGTMTNSFQSLLMNIPGVAENAVKVASYILIMGIAQVADFPYTVRQMGMFFTTLGKGIGRGVYNFFDNGLYKPAKLGNAFVSLGNKIKTWVTSQPQYPKDAGKGWKSWFVFKKIGPIFGGGIAVLINAIGMGILSLDGAEYFKNACKAGANIDIPLKTAETLAMVTNSMESTSFGVEAGRAKLSRDAAEANYMPDSSYGTGGPGPAAPVIN